MVNDNSLSDSVLIQIGVLEKDIKGLKDTLYSLEHSGESGRGYDRQVANIKNQIQQKTKQIQQFKRSINMNDSMEQLKLMGFTTDAEPFKPSGGYKTWDPELIKRKWVEAKKQGASQEVLNKLDKEYQEAVKERVKTQDAEQVKSPKEQLIEYAKKENDPEYLKHVEGLKNSNTINARLNWHKQKDDDATEHGSIETYGKEKETETMPLEKDPVQAQDTEEPTNAVKDSYEMLKLCGIVS